MDIIKSATEKLWINALLLVVGKRTDQLVEVEAIYDLEDFDPAVDLMTLDWEGVSCLWT